MKEIKAFIKPMRSKEVVYELRENGFESMTLSKAEGTGSHETPDAFPSLDFNITDSMVVKLEMVCDDEKVDEIVKIISNNGRSNEPGDGIIYISNVEKAYKVKTGSPITTF